jgi:hypothetical protein
VGTATSSQTITVSNSGSAVMNVSGVTIGGADAGDFSQTNTCGSTIAAGANCAVSVVFKPTASGTRSANVSLSDDASGSPQTVALSGALATTTDTVSPTSVALGSEPLGTASAAKTITVSNTGTGSLSLTGISVSGTKSSEFAQTNTCGSSLSAGSSCTVSVTFKPSAAGAATASVMIADTAPNSPQTVALSGTGMAPVASVSTTSVSFANQGVGTTSTAQTVTLKNTGNESMTISRIALGGTNSSDFAETNNCGTSLAASASCTISLTFTPATAGSLSGALAITDNAAGSPQSVALAGNGSSTTVSVSPSSIAFGNQAVGVASAVHTVIVKNSGSSALTLSSIAVLGTNASSFAETNNCGTSLASNASCTVSVTFKPASAAALSAAVAITDDATGSPQSVALTGTGTSTGVTVAPSSVAFGNEAENVASASHSVTITNSGSSALTISSISILGTNSADFSQNNTCGTSLAAGASCTVAVLFTPRTTGSLAGDLTITDNATGSPQAVPLTGTGTSSTSHYVSLTWTASTSSGVVGYYVYRGTSSGGESGTPINSSPVNAANYTDNSVTAGTEYFYTVTAVASDGTTQSVASDEASASVP